MNAPPRKCPGSVPAEASRGVNAAPTESLYTNDDGSDGVVMKVDCSECGGDRVGLGMNTRYRTCRLESGDYGWLWRAGGSERELPYLVERKRADDLSRTLKENRFWPQITKMTNWKDDYKSRGISATLTYLIEGTPEEYVTQCRNNCQGVGRCGHPSVTQVKRTCSDLEMHPIDVVYTQNLEETVLILASMTSDLETRAKKGELDFLVALELTEHETKVDNGDNSIYLTADELYNYDVPCGQPPDSITISTSSACTEHHQRPHQAFHPASM